MTKTPDSSELLSCPFCGGEAIMRSDGPYHIVNCATCPADIADEVKRKAIKAWNRRPDRSPAGEVRVKPLEWGPLTEWEDQAGPDDREATTPAGDYRVWEGSRWKKGLGWLVSLNGEPVGDYASADEAKAAAQADYEARIRAALSPAPDPEREGQGLGLRSDGTIELLQAEVRRLRAALTAYEEKKDG